MDAGADWEVVHGEICSLGRKRAEHEHALGRALLRAQRTRVWEALGMATLFEYAERFVGLRPRQTEERLRVAFALEDLPILDAALSEGHLHYSAVRELTRVVEPDTEEAWIEAVKGKTVNEIAGMVAPATLETYPRTPSGMRRGGIASCWKCRRRPTPHIERLRPSCVATAIHR